MRKALVISVAAHALILGVGFAAFPELRPFADKSVDALPVELVSVDDATDILKGTRSAEALPEAEPQAQPNRKDEQALKSVIAEAEKPGKSMRVISTARSAASSEPARALDPASPTEVTPAAKKEPPAAEPKTKAEADVAALPRPPAIRPKARPTPPVRVAEAVVAQERPQQTLQPPQPSQQSPAFQPEPVRADDRTPPPRSLLAQADGRAAPVDLRDQSFRSRDIAALLDKRDPAAGASPDASLEPQTLGIENGLDSASMTMSEIDALKSSLHRCWSPPRGVREAGALQVTVGIDLNPDGSLAGHPRVLTSAFDSLTQIAAESAVRAVYSCAPFDMLPPEKYALWRNIEFTFDPREMLGG